MRLLAIVSLTLLLAACIPMPQRVLDEFSRYDGERPNNFITGGDRAGQEESGQDVGE